ncbi:YheT family hydrolase [Fodinibius sp. Rm-B-1B1-1]|uniref:YheT family hydrolase n=1 Tax=Fodinibius alkaliphilus TaxID=3140241 RepID=UPI0031599F70
MKTNLRHVPRFHSPFWCYNGHLHTIARSLCGDTSQPEINRIEITTPDNDFLELDQYINPYSDSIIVLFHGLEGSTERYYMVELMKVLIRKGHSIIGVNFRGCGSRLNKQPRFYHSGETNDYQTVLEWAQNQYPNKKLGAVGFSLGGNALVKYLGETGKDSLVQTAVAVSVPYDLRLGSIMLSKGFHRIYEFRFLRTLSKKLEAKRKHYPDLPTFNGSTLYEFDNQITAPIHGFENADDYYETCSARRFVNNISVDTLLIHSKEDPLCPAKAMPLDRLNNNPYTDYIITKKGGHVGFWSKPQGWLNYVIENYLSSNL